MRKLVVLTFISLDGVMQAPGGKGEDPSGGFKFEGWVFPYFDDFGGKEMDKQMKQPFELLLGRKTYDIFASYWPDHGDNWPGVNKTKKYVVSHKNIQLPWENSVLIKDSVVPKIKKLKKEDGPDIQVHGSGNLIQTLLANDLVDELWLKFFPITLGKGKKLFSGGTIPAAFKLTYTKSSPSGVVFANYKRDGKVKTGSFS